MRILIIEDNPDLRDIFDDLFVRAGHKTQVANNGRSGIDIVDEFKPHVVLLDIMMPEMNGYDFLQALGDKKTKPFIVVVSNLTQQSDIDVAKQRGAHAYLRKSDFAGEALVKETERLYKIYSEERKGA